ncbi:MobF family relaxase [Trebonia kvetii]|uniref:MobF family relaxase n=1 Tax=Trebonia kvetii TaxID=2480626 RepID=UPI001651E4EA|nr:MobF family relaxase [Trebonia kvetii]
MAVIATLSKGYDLDYIWKQVDQATAKDAAGYYIQAAETGGEPPGRWWGPGAQALGLEPGQIVERKPYDLLFGEHKAPDGTPLGRPPGSGRKAAEIYTQLLAAEPHATAERKRELRLEATRQARQSPLFFDLTLSLSKSISIFHASLGENARLARQAGDTAGDEYWSALVAEVDAMIWQAVHAGFEYFHREAGYTRTGSHNKRVNGRETGQWHEADLAVAHWLQHTSRDGDMQLHVHAQIAHVARTSTDGKWRAPDSLGYNEHIGAVAAITAQNLEEALTARFGLEWTPRDDGHGFEIAGISGEMMRLFSSRRESITADLRARAARFQQHYGRAPSQRELAQLGQASNFATRKSKEGALDTEQLHADWADKLARTLGVPLASVAPSVWHVAANRADAPAREAGGPETVTQEVALARAGQQAVALAQQEKSTWTRADLVKYLGRVLPRTGRNPAQAAALLEDLADCALRSEFEPVCCLEAPEPAPVPSSLLRADGRSVYRRHGGVRYATAAQLTMEERMVAQASAQGAPRLTRDAAAQALGADPADLDRILHGGAESAPAGQRTGSGLRADQAAAALAALTDGRRVSVINAPAGSGKTRTLAEAARAWTAAGLGPVIGIAASQSARNTLAAGIPDSYNAAQFLGHLPSGRGARGPVPIRPGTLLVIDEASMMTSPDLADLIALAETNGAKVIIAGDTGQLQAVQNGGGMTLLAGRLGYVRLAEPVRFRALWEQAASLRLRDGDTTVLDEYDQHARITGGDPEQMLDAAASAYTALTTQGTDVLLMAADHSLRRELSRRIRDDLIRLGHVDPGPAIRIADGAMASRGDLIVCTRNHHEVEAGEPGRTLANGDLLRIDAITASGLLVRRALDADPATGQRRWTDRQFLYAHYEEAELGYAVTDHAAQGRTVTAGLAVITGTEDRQHAYVALTRGTDSNTAYVFTQSPKRADITPGPRPAPELARYDRLTARQDIPDPAVAGAETDDALGVLAEVLGRDGQELSAMQAWQQALADADHLAILHAIWTVETAPAREQRYRELLAAALPPGYRLEASHKEKWLWRTLRASELAGLDPGQVLTDAVAERNLTGARDIPAVIDARIRRRTGTLIPLPAPAWSDQPAAIADPGRRAYADEIAMLMDARKERIGEHAAASTLPWAVTGLGPVPGDPLTRLEWQQRAASIGAYRELSGYNHPADPIGAEPASGSPDLRAAWHEALAALGPADRPDVRGMPDGLLLRLRDTYPIETAWAPPWVGDELRRARAGARDAHLAALRAAAEAAAAGLRDEPGEAARQQARAASYHALHDSYRQREGALATAMADRADWEQATRHQRHLTVAADAELRRRHPEQSWPPLRSAEPQPVTEDKHGIPTAGERSIEAEQRVTDLAAQHREFSAKLAERQSLMTPAEDHDFEDLGPGFPAWTEPDRDPILQPPRPQIQPSERLLELTAGREPDFEAGD